MVDFLSSPILFPSDMDSSKLAADPTFKLPAAMNWTLLDKPMTGLTDLVQLEPINENELHIYLEPTFMDLRDDDSGYGDDDNQAKQMALRAHLRGALALVENDIQKNGYDGLYIRGGACQDKSDSWSWREEIVDVPELVHSVCSSSAQSLLDTSPTTPVLLESTISSLFNDTFIDESTLPCQITADKIKPRKNWMAKIKQAKQDCVKSVSRTSRKISQWIKN